MHGLCWCWSRVCLPDQARFFTEPETSSCGQAMATLSSSAKARAVATHRASRVPIQSAFSTQQKASTLTYVTTMAGGNTTFREQRRAAPGIMPRHNDAFTIGYLLTILQYARGQERSGKSVLARVCDVAVIPQGYLDIRLTACDTMGASITFPSEWLRLQLQAPAQDETAGATPADKSPPESPLDAIHHVLEQHLHKKDFNADQVADLLGLSKRTLSRKLARMNTSLAREIVHQRRQIAERELERG